MRWWLLGIAGCGRVLSISPDAAPVADTAPDGPFCASPTVECSAGLCVNEMTDSMHCGSCSMMCGVTEGCGAGHCIDATASCVNIKLIDDTAATGPYTHNGTQFYCDMTKSPPVQYEELALGIYSTGYAGFTMIDGAQLADTAIQDAFLWLFDFQNGGARALTSWTPVNVCVTVRATGLTRLTLGSSLVFAQGPFTMGSVYTFTLVNQSPQVTPTKPISPTFFQMYPANETANCGDATNPALFFKKH